MSWFARSLANSLRLDDDKDDDDDEDNDVVSECANDPDPPPSSSTKLAPARHQQQQQQQQQYEPEDNDSQVEEAQSRGVKDDLSELKQTLTRQIWGMASFLAPPPSQPSTLSPHYRHSEPSDQSKSGDREDPSDDAASWIRSDIGEDEGTFRSGVTEISKMALNFLPFGSERYEGLLEERGLGESVGITEEVLAFARNIAMHPETWLDFPLDEEEDLDVNYRALILTFTGFLNFSCKIYGSCDIIMAARAMWMQELQKITKENTDWFARSTSYSKDSANILEEDFDPIPPIFSFEPSSSTVATDFETEKHPIESTELEFIDKSVIVEEPTIKTENKDLLGGPSSKLLVQNFEDDEDDWPEEDSEVGRYSGAAICVGNEDDISFSDLEDDDYSIVPITSKTVASKG
ncbi:hypothetical protein F2P56_025596 [Juglans regia]|uniref:BSD domain-containing protein n=1 Tax=Juglans regia TaxID=51240 RepID=A0A833X1F2_JUGRE|nr:hypothetical protein F2P56_025596 [Juglans regia]